MPLDRTIRQAILLRSASPTIVAKSQGIEFADEESLLRFAVKFGTKPNNTTCPLTVFALPLNSHTIVIAQVDEPIVGTLAFRYLLMQRETYRVLGDPFAIAERYPPNWSARGELPTLEWPEEYQPPRRVEELLTMLKASDSPLLLGSTQALLDGAAISVANTDVPEGYVRHVWQLLPDRVRCELWPASFTYGSDLPFQIQTSPSGTRTNFLDAEQARDYPEGRYELALQLAIESGDQGELDRLLNRKSSAEVLRMAAAMLLVTIIVVAILKVV